MSSVRISLRIRWILAKATVRFVLALLWTTRDSNPVRWAEKLRDANRLRRKLRDALDQSLVGEGDR